MFQRIPFFRGFFVSFRECIDLLLDQDDDGDDDDDDDVVVVVVVVVDDDLSCHIFVFCCCSCLFKVDIKVSLVWMCEV